MLSSINQEPNNEVGVEVTCFKKSNAPSPTQIAQQMQGFVVKVAILDRLSFRRFLGLDMADRPIDHSTIGLFRKRLHDEGLAGELFEIVNTHLRARGGA